jgi:hypothetical protein
VLVGSAAKGRAGGPSLRPQDLLPKTHSRPYPHPQASHRTTPTSSRACWTLPRPAAAPSGWRGRRSCSASWTDSSGTTSGVGPGLGRGGWAGAAAGAAPATDALPASDCPGARTHGPAANPASRFSSPPPAAPGGWFDAAEGSDPALTLRLKEDYDGAEPAPASVAVANLVRLAAIAPAFEAPEAVGGGGASTPPAAGGEEAWLARADAALAAAAARLAAPAAVVAPQMCCSAWLRARAPLRQVGRGGSPAPWGLQAQPRLPCNDRVPAPCKWPALTLDPPLRARAAGDRIGPCWRARDARSAVRRARRYLAARPRSHRPRPGLPRRRCRVARAQPTRARDGGRARGAAARARQRRRWRRRRRRRRDRFRVPRLHVPRADG